MGAVQKSLRLSEETVRQIDELEGTRGGFLRHGKESAGRSDQDEKMPRDRLRLRYLRP